MRCSHRDDVDVLVDFFKQLSNGLKLFHDLVFSVYGGHDFGEDGEVLRLSCMVVPELIFLWE